MVTIQQGLSNVTKFASDQAEGLLGNPLATAVGGAIVGGLVTGAVVKAASSRKKTTRRTTARKRSKPRKRVASRSRRKSPRYARTAGKGKDTSSRRIRMTKNGQPYIILRSGKARFIKKSSARASRKKKGGRY